jgi:hypothetical protein
VLQADLEAAVTDAVVLPADDGRRRKSWMVSGRGSFTTWSGWTVVARIVSGRIAPASTRKATSRSENPES